MQCVTQLIFGICDINLIIVPCHLSTMANDKWRRRGHKFYVYVYDCRTYAPTYFIWNNSWLAAFRGFLEVLVFLRVTKYPSISIRLSVDIIRPLWLLTFFLYLSRWGALAMANLGTWIKGIMVVARARVMFCLCYWKYYYVMYYYVGLCPGFHSDDNVGLWFGDLYDTYVHVTAIILVFYYYCAGW